MIHIDITEDQITEVLERLGAKLVDMTDLMNGLGELLIDSTEQRFADGKDPDGNPWAAKSQTTIDAQNRAEARGAGRAVDLRPLIGPSRRLGSEIHYVSSPTSVEIGSSLIYAAVQQFGAKKGQFGTAANGSSVPWGNIPARPFIGVSDSDRTNVIEAAEEWLRDAATGAA